jgi:putative ABC transport system substrate-binding protein
MPLNQLKRREIIALLGVASVTWPLVARAREPAKLPVIGFLGSTSASIASPRIAVFEQRLHDLGWIDGRTVAINYRWADGVTERFGEIAAEFVRLKVDVIVTWGLATALAAKAATSTIPIVFALVTDPLAAGLVASLARPGGNATGLSSQHADTAGKRLGLLRDMVPSLRRLAILANIDNPGPLAEMRDVEALARSTGLEVARLEIRRVEDIAPSLEAIEGRADALYVVADALISNNRVQINTLAMNERLPTMHGFQEIVAAGGLMSYAPNYLDLFRRAAEYVDKILRGATQTISRSSSRPSSIWLSISGPPIRSTSPSRRRCWRLPTK